MIGGFRDLLSFCFSFALCLTTVDWLIHLLFVAYTSAMGLHGPRSLTGYIESQDEKGVFRGVETRRRSVGDREMKITASERMQTLAIWARITGLEAEARSA